ncbi:hypothetical protein ANN_17453 [Periplaneta americana]|uniref:Uncharacterized protein n=1 Tax=Periplaneta americana TaxID=6978 RepID=A0ABQ8SU93_PERAM|nr:hypothetical protein ANN_17453 [Periplaneta americana]
MAGLFEGGNEPSGSLKAICNYPDTATSIRALVISQGADYQIPYEDTTDFETKFRYIRHFNTAHVKDYGKNKLTVCANNFNTHYIDKKKKKKKKEKEKKKKLIKFMNAKMILQITRYSTPHRELNLGYCRDDDDDDDDDGDDDDDDDDDDNI